MYDIVAVGECLIDFVCSEREGKLFLEGNPGGAPANVLAMAAKLGLSTAVVTKVGRDGFGRFLQEKLCAAGIDTATMRITPDYPTTLAIVQLDSTGNRSFSFYRDDTADVMLAEEEIPYNAIKNAAILHFGAVSLTTEPARSATLAAARYAKQEGVLVSYDPNLRKPLWKSLETAKEVILQGMALSNLVKLSDEELFFLTDAATLEDGMEQLFETYHPQLLAVTLGARGCACRTRAGTFFSETFDTPCIDTTGAGDAFWGATLSWLLCKNKAAEDCSPAELAEWMDFANAAGSLATTKKGAIPAMPDRQEIDSCIKNIPRCKQEPAIVV